MLRQLDLTEAQRGQIKAVVDGHKPDFGEIGKRMREARKRLQAAMQAPVVDEVAIRAASADVAAVEADANVLRATVRVEVFNILTPEQRTKAAELKAKAEARRAVMGERMKARRAQRPQGGF
jgi:protein CpxP